MDWFKNKFLTHKGKKSDRKGKSPQIIIKENPRSVSW